MVQINENLCKNCGDEEKCITCAICATMCPEGAIEVTEGGSKA